MTDKPASWKTYFDEWGPSLLLFARQQTGYLAEAEDVVQEAFFKVWKKYGQKTEITKSLLYATVRTTAIDFSRSQGRRKLREHKLYEDGDGDTTWFQRNLETRERDSLLEEAVQKLSKDQQEVLVLKIWGELTFQEIADTLGISHNTAASRYRYALEHLKKLLKPSMI
jgi:RNA polymerase sigma-70 factor, ECF subfamily